MHWRGSIVQRVPRRRYRLDSGLDPLFLSLASIAVFQSWTMLPFCSKPTMLIPALLRNKCFKGTLEKRTIFLLLMNDSVVRRDRHDGDQHAVPVLLYSLPGVNETFSKRKFCGYPRSCLVNLNKRRRRTKVSNAEPASFALSNRLAFLASPSSRITREVTTGICSNRHEYYLWCNRTELQVQTVSWKCWADRNCFIEPLPSIDLETRKTLGPCGFQHGMPFFRSVLAVSHMPELENNKGWIYCRYARSTERSSPQLTMHWRLELHNNSQKKQAKRDDKPDSEKTFGNNYQARSY